MTAPAQPPSSPAVRAPVEPAWTGTLLANPHGVADKAARVNKMFSAIAPSYDLNNRLHSLWMDQHWRSVAVKMAGVKRTDSVVDVACGTGDLTIKFGEKLYGMACPGRAGQVTGIDFTLEMLPIAAQKWARHGIVYHDDPEDNPGSAEFVQFVQGDALALPLSDQSVDVVSIAFGIRNVADWGAAIDEFARVLRPGGRLVILEFSLPRNALLRGVYNFYFRKVLPVTATLISGDKTGAYKYLPESVNTFISREAMRGRLERAGFAGVEARVLTWGICVCYKGVKRGPGKRQGSGTKGGDDA